ncbi:hypothetical protein DTO271D3_4397 [Paecilomyces variotii]|nr:hypothetical protein DTO032I3_1553 [Paecilomyces variotii]KAJ9272624.1 hypothetical protein DTO212C5_1351 [Paecilomyces variotii]KAJ9281478.1 hypothetical protein DTO021D3_1701 [Paecilomyces variotii]KAJ9315230.1 hypothetical protein DTO271D3_4397 [Paecilomyces variotii]KAJ9346737.1 hypothetical protein DTO027B6_991 [Paecilomyces variotii]
MVIPRTTLLEPARTLCNAFASASPVSELVRCFTSDPMPIAHEHGHPSLAPFLGRTFTGQQGITKYFELLNEHLTFENMRFDPEDEWVVDSETLVVCLKGRARFIWRATGEGWNETFCYRLGLAEDISQDGKGGYKVQEYRVWADTGAAYLASKKELRLLEGQKDPNGNAKAKAAGDKLGSGMNVYGSCG